MTPAEVAAHLAARGVWAEVDRLYDAVENGENPFTDALPVDEVIARMEARA